MAKRNIRAQIRGGRLEPLERVPFPEGAEVTVTGEVVEEAAAPPRVEFAAWDLGVKPPLTRADIYEDVG